MNYRWIFLLIPLLASPVFAYQFPTEIIERFDDNKIVAFVNESHFTNSKPWNPLQEAPPLTVAGAIRGVKKHYIAEKNDIADLSIAEIEIRKTPLHKGLWHYIIKAHAKGKNIYYFILMNGVVIPAVVEPESYK